MSSVLPVLFLSEVSEYAHVLERKQLYFRGTHMSSSTQYILKRCSMTRYQCLLFSFVFGHTDITVRCGQDVTLHCQDPSGVNITLLEWSIPEIKSDGYVFFYRNRRSYESYQHERFKGRVELADPSMKNGNVSVILKNVNVNDTGTYECRIITSDLSSGQRVQSESRQSIDLTVIDSGELRGSLYYLFFFWLVGTCRGKLQPSLHG